MIIKGILKEESKLPSVRELSKELTVNPNTVQKAYKELEREGYIYTVAGLGCFVAAKDQRNMDEKRAAELVADLHDIVQELMFIGMNESKIISEIKKAFSEGGGQI